eukprot:12562744-Ditylum_brightwellii.AAC.1
MRENRRLKQRIAQLETHYGALEDRISLLEEHNKHNNNKSVEKNSVCVCGGKEKEKREQIGSFDVGDFISYSSKPSM